jgi:hypothetical protein
MTRTDFGIVFQLVNGYKKMAEYQFCIECLKWEMPKMPKVPKMPKIMASLRSVFSINAWYFQHQQPEISK